MITQTTDKIQELRGLTIDDTNKLTLDSYSRHVADYAELTSPRLKDYSPAMQEWIDGALDLIARDNSVILEIGSAQLRDASYMRSRGYNVVCSDGAQGFVDSLRGLGESALQLDILKDNIMGDYNMVFANGVFPHFSSDEAGLALDKIRLVLKPAGILAVSIKLGDGESMKAEKFNDYCYTRFWQENDFLKLTEKAGFTTKLITRNRGDFPSHNWLNIVLQK